MGTPCFLLQKGRINLKRLNRYFKDSALNQKIRALYDMKREVNDSGMDYDTKYTAMKYYDKEINKCWRYHYAGLRGYESGDFMMSGGRKGFKNDPIRYAKKVFGNLNRDSNTLKPCPFCGGKVRVGFRMNPYLQVDDGELGIAKSGYGYISGDYFKEGYCTCDSFEFGSRIVTEYNSLDSVDKIRDDFISLWDRRV